MEGKWFTAGCSSINTVQFETIVDHLLKLRPLIGLYLIIDDCGEGRTFVMLQGSNELHLFCYFLLLFSAGRACVMCETPLRLSVQSSPAQAKNCQSRGRSSAGVKRCANELESCR